jgi:hypothetical protein
VSLERKAQGLEGRNVTGLELLQVAGLWKQVCLGPSTFLGVLSATAEQVCPSWVSGRGWGVSSTHMSAPRDTLWASGPRPEGPWSRAGPWTSWA